MSSADTYFRQEAERLLTEGFSDRDYEVRPKWPDGTPAHTVKVDFAVRTYDLEKEFPILTLRKQAFKGVVREMLWVFQKKSNIVDELGRSAGIWRAWEREDGTIGKTYGYQLSVKHQYDYGTLDQVDNLLYLLKNRPMDRRMILDLWNPEDMHDMALPPCVFLYMFQVVDGRLDMTVIQRSGDLLAAASSGGWDTVEAALLQSAVAQVTGYRPGMLHHVVHNLHIYDRHIPLVKRVLENPEYPAPKLWINPEVKDFYDFTEDDFKLIDYEATKLEDRFEVAE